MGSRKKGISSTEINLMKHAKKELEDALTKTNSFFKNEWIEFKSNLQEQTMPIFKEVEELKLFKTKAITVFAVVQFAMAAIVFAMNFIG